MLYTLNLKYQNSNLVSAGRCPLSKKTSLNVSTKMHLIIKRSMQRAIQSVSKIVSENGPAIARYSTLVMTNQESTQDTSKCNHPSGVILSCDTQDCLKINCAQDTNQCDPTTMKSEIAFHTTHSLKGVEPNKVTAELETKNNEKIFAVIHEQREETPHAYTDYLHQDTQLVQESQNTKKIQDALQQAEQNTNNE